MATEPTRSVLSVLAGQGAALAGRDWWDQAEVRRQKGWAFPFPLTTTVAAAYATLITRVVRVPNYVRGGDVLRCHFFAKHKTGGATVYGRFCNGSTKGTAGTVTGTALTLVYSDLTVPDDTWAGTFQTFTLEAHRGASGVGSLSTTRLTTNVRVIAP